MVLKCKPCQGTFCLVPQWISFATLHESPWVFLLSYPLPIHVPLMCDPLQSIHQLASTDLPAHHSSVQLPIHLPKHPSTGLPTHSSTQYPHQPAHSPSSWVQHPPGAFSASGTVPGAAELTDELDAAPTFKALQPIYGWARWGGRITIRGKEGWGFWRKWLILLQP